MKKLFLVLTLALCSAAVYGATRTEELGNQFKLNQASPGAMAETRLGDQVVLKSVRKMRAYWDFSVSGGAAGTFTLLDAATGKSAVLPKGAIVRDCLFDIITAPSPLAIPSATPSPTIAFSTGQSAGDLKAAAATGAYTGLVACIPVGTAASAIKLTADRTMTMVLTPDAVAQGKIYVLVTYEMSDTL